MENELKIFKKKIALRYANREIVDFAFPRILAFTDTTPKSNS